MGGHRPTVVAFRLRSAAPAVFWSWNGLAAACMAPLAEAWARAFCVAEGSTRRLDGGDPTSVALHTHAAVASTRALPSASTLTAGGMGTICSPMSSDRSSAPAGNDNCAPLFPRPARTQHVVRHSVSTRHPAYLQSNRRYTCRAIKCDRHRIKTARTKGTVTR